MSLYSETVGSFSRTGNYPLESHYIFSSEAALKEFYSDPLNLTTLHKGLLKIVEDDGTGNLALYWVVPNSVGDLEFTKLIVGKDVDSIYEQLDSLLTTLKLEILDRQNGDKALWGTEDSTGIPDDLNSIKDLAEAIQGLNTNYNTLKELLQTTVGTDRDNIVDYLQSLPYTSLTDVANTLHNFLNEVDNANPEITTFKELQNFLEGYSDTDKLIDILNTLLNDFIGDPKPSEEFSSLRNIEDFVRILQVTLKAVDSNLQSELDLTQIGVGLSGDGSYNADKETYYLKNATSVMNALKILDLTVYNAVVTHTLGVDNNDIVDLAVRQELDGWKIGAKLNLSTTYGNLLIKQDNGLYYNVITEYKNGELRLKVNNNIVASHNLALSAIIESARYDSENEQIVLVFNLQDGTTLQVSIPVGAIIREWEEDNTHPDRVVELYREESVDGHDKLSGDVRLSTNQYNILVKDGNTLLVEGTTSNINHEGEMLDIVLNNKADLVDGLIDSSQLPSVLVWHNVV